ncbi:hypothetical protein VI06_09570 [Aquitalea magnusonii]|nr:hypothetical protein VI06_09570 [Aquitalea magnusonii]
MLTMLPGLALFMLGGLLMLYQFYSGIQSALESQLSYKLEKIEQILDQAQSTGDADCRVPASSRMA